jgi:hypothetical protein
VIKICLKGQCNNVRLIRNDSGPVRCEVRIELDHGVSLTTGLYDVALLVPAEFATLLETGRALTLTLEQNGS